MNDFRIKLYEDNDLELGWDRLACRLIPYGADGYSSTDLILLWCGFIERIDATYTIDAFYITMFGAGHGDEETWRKFSRPYLDAGIERAIEAYIAGVPVDDILGV